MAEQNDIVLGRHPMKFDPRDFRLAEYITPEMRALAGQRTYMDWKVDNILDQGKTPHCVGFAWAAFGVSEPVENLWRNDMGHKIYYMAKEIEGAPMEESGSDTRSGVKAFMKFGKLQNNAYAFAHSLDDIIVWLLTKGPVVTGTNWYSGMYETDKDGLVRVYGDLDGGHEWMLSGVDTIKRLFKATNSWGESYGINGQFYISFDDYQRLFDEQGDAVTTSELEAAPEKPLDTSLGYAGKFIRQNLVTPNIMNILSETTVRGASLLKLVKFPDLSFYNGKPDFNTIATWTKGVIVRVGQGIWPDTEFVRNYSEAKKLGLARGVYWFYDDRYSPESQSNLLLSYIKNEPPEMEIFIDWENTYNGVYNGIVNVVKMMRLVKDSMPDSEVGIYTGYYWFKDHASMTPTEFDFLSKSPLWLAWYTSNPAYVLVPQPWSKITHWQYGTPTMPGVPGECDMNYANMTEAEFAQKYPVSTVPPEQDVPVPTHVGIDYYHIRRFGTDCYIHVVDLTKVQLKIVEGFRAVPDAISKYSANLAFNGGGWGLQPGNASAPNEYLIIDGVVKQAVAVDGRPAIEVTKDNRILFHVSQPNFNTSWNVWGFDRIIAQGGIYNTKITNTVADPRTVYGKDVDGKLVILVCEGRSSSQKGLTFPEIWSVMQEFNVTDCGNADGGYSSAAVNDYFNPPLLNPNTYNVENRRTEHQIILFADGGTTPPPPPGGNVYRYSATSILARALRDEHNAYGNRVGDIAAGVKVEGDELYVAPTDIYDAIGNLLNKAGDQWLRVLTVGGLSKMGWTAIIHKGVQQMTIIDSGPVTPPPTSTWPPYYILEDPDGNKMRYNQDETYTG